MPDAIDHTRAAAQEEKVAEEGGRGAGHGDKAVGSYRIAVQEGRRGTNNVVAEATRKWCTHDVLKGLPGVKKCLWR
jgi:hypothetical protein